MTLSIDNFIECQRPLTRQQAEALRQEWERRYTGGFWLEPGVKYLDATAASRPPEPHRSPEYAPIETPPRLRLGPLLCLATSIAALIVVLLK